MNNKTFELLRNVNRILIFKVQMIYNWTYSFYFEEVKLTDLNWYLRKLNLRPWEGVHFKVWNQHHQTDPSEFNLDLF